MPSGSVKTGVPGDEGDGVTGAPHHDEGLPGGADLGPRLRARARAGLAEVRRNGTGEAADDGSWRERLFDLSLDILCTFRSADWRLVHANRAMERTLGWTRAELAQRPAFEWIHPDDRDVTVQAEDVLTADRDLMHFENRWRHRDGGHRRLLWSARPVGDMVYCVAKDVTEARRAEAQRDREAELTAAIAGAVDEGLVVADATGRVVYANPAALAALGLGAVPVGRTVHDLLHPGAPCGTAPAACTLLAPPCGAEGGRRREVLGGGPGALPVLLACAPIRLETGGGHLLTFRDVRREERAAAARADAEARLRRSEALHRTLVAHLPDTTLFLVDHDLRILLAQGEGVRALDWFADDLYLGRRIDELHGEVPPEVLGAALEHYRAALAGERRAFEVSASGGVQVAVEAVPVPDEDGGVGAALVVARDVTDRARSERELARRARQQQSVADLGRFALGVHDLDDVIAHGLRAVVTTLDVEMATVLEYAPEDESLRVATVVGVPPEREHRFRTRFPVADGGNAGAALTADAPVVVEDWTHETRFRPAENVRELGVVSSLAVAVAGRVRPWGVLNVHSREPRRFSPDDVAFVRSVATLIAVALERNREEEATRHAALHDALTGLPNRTLALDRLGRALRRRRREGIDVAVLVLDVDRFKVVNDSLGHAAGDRVLLEMAPRLAAVLRPADTVARIGGDEFVIVCEGVEGPTGARDIAERIEQAIARPVTLDNVAHVFSVSIGIALAAGAEDTPESLIRDADAAMYRAKERGRGRHEMFDEEMRRRVLARVTTESDLRRALERGELEVWHQPVFDVTTGRPAATEALVRWRHPERGLIPPAEFIPIAEEAGLIGDVGLVVLEHACRHAARWRAALGARLGVAVNVSGRQLADPLFPAQVARILERTGLAPGALLLEITESVLMEESSAPDAVLESLHRLGPRLALDDFGTGYSSLSRLKRFPLDALKIDRAFVAGVHEDTDDAAIVKATIDMAHAIGLLVVAEGVETAAQRDALRALGCDRAQGFLLARPMPAAATMAHLRAALAADSSVPAGPGRVADT